MMRLKTFLPRLFLIGLLCQATCATATTWLLEDAVSHTVLSEENVETTPATQGLTPLMALYVLLKNTPEPSAEVLDWAQATFISQSPEALNGLIHATGRRPESLLDAMNQTMKAWDLSIRFESLSAPIKATPHELLKATQTFLTDFPYVKGWSTLSRKKIGKQVFENRARSLPLLGTQSLLIPLGNEQSALIWVAKSEPPARTLFMIVLDAASERELNQRVLKEVQAGLYDWSTFEVHKAQTPLTALPVYGGKHPTVNVGLAQPLWVSLPHSALKKTQTDPFIMKLLYEAPLMAPLEKGAPIGTLQLEAPGQATRQLPVIALDAVQQDGRWRRLIDTLKLIFNFNR